MKIQELINKNKGKILFNGGSMIPSDVNCAVCTCFKASCNGIIYDGRCPLNTESNTDIYNLYSLLEELNFNNFEFAKCFGVDITSDEIKENISFIEDAINKSVNEDFKNRAKATLEKYYEACNSSEKISELLNKDINFLFNTDKLSC